MTKLFLELLFATKHITKLVILHQQNVGVGLCLTNECQHIKITHYHQSPSSLSILTLLTRVTRQTTVNTGWTPQIICPMTSNPNTRG